jgi:hypothetical protein
MSRFAKAIDASVIAIDRISKFAWPNDCAVKRGAEYRVQRLKYAGRVQLAILEVLQEKVRIAAIDGKWAVGGAQIGRRPKVCEVRSACVLETDQHGGQNGGANSNSM